MPVRYRIFEDLRLVVTTWYGDVTLEQARQFTADLRTDPSFAPDMLQLSDARRARSLVTAEGVRGLARNSAFGPEARRAIVALDDEIFGVSRMYEAQATDAGTLAIFRDRGEALAWLGLTPDQVPEEAEPSSAVSRSTPTQAV